MQRSAIPGDDHDWGIRPSFSTTTTTTTRIVSRDGRQLIVTQYNGDRDPSAAYTSYTVPYTLSHQSFQALATPIVARAGTYDQPSWYSSHSRPTAAWTPNTLHMGSHLTQAYTGPNGQQNQGTYSQFYGDSVDDPVFIGGYGPFVPQNSSMIASSQQPSQGLLQPQYPYTPSYQHDHGQLAYGIDQFRPYYHDQFQLHG